MLPGQRKQQPQRLQLEQNEQAHCELRQAQELQLETHKFVQDEAKPGLHKSVHSQEQTTSRDSKTSGIWQELYYQRRPTQACTET